MTSKISEKEHVQNLVYDAMKPARPFQIVGAEEYCKPDYHWLFEASAHVHNCLIYFLDGSGVLTHGDEKYFPKAGDVVFMKRGFRWEYSCDEDNPWHIIWINVIGDLPEAMAAGYRLSDITYFPEVNSPRLFYDFLSKKAQSYHGRGEQTDMFLVIYLQILQMLAQRYYEGGSVTANSNAFYVKDYIDFHYHEPLTNRNFSEMSSYSVSNLCRLFRAAYGMTPQNYLMQVRLTHAAEKLIESNQPIGTVAASTGFPDVRYFCRRFHVAYGCSPSMYRKKNRTNEKD